MDIQPITVMTKGEAFLRNGWSGVTAIRLCEDWHGRATIEVENTRGLITSGSIRVQPVDFARLCKLFLEANPQLLPEAERPRIIVEVDSGVADVTESPAWCWVEVIDHDVEEEDEPPAPPQI